MTLSDYGVAIWDKGVRGADLSMSVVPLTLSDFDTHREVDGVLYIDGERSFGVTLRTSQTMIELACLCDKAEYVRFAGRFDPDIGANKLGHPCRKLVGLAGRADRPKPSRRAAPTPPRDAFPYGIEVGMLTAIMQSKASIADQKAAMRKIGVRLHREDGMEAMIVTAMEVRQRYAGGKPDFNEGWHPQLIDYAWNGIGRWQA